MELKFLPRVDRLHREKRIRASPTPNTSGTGPEFPIAIQRNSKYRAATEHCVSIERRESNALLLAEHV